MIKVAQKTATQNKIKNVIFQMSRQTTEDFLKTTNCYQS
jgi:hypothetical protein